MKSKIFHKNGSPPWQRFANALYLSMYIIIIFNLAFLSGFAANSDTVIDLGLSPAYFVEGELPKGWKLKKTPGYTSDRVTAKWIDDNGTIGIKLQSKGSLTFLKKTVNIDIQDYPVVSWRWKVENTLERNDERTVRGDDHPIRIFFVFEPDKQKQTLWFRTKRVLFLDIVHGHPVGGRFTEYLWSSHLETGEIIKDPSKPMQKLIVVEGGSENLGKWIKYERNLYEDFKMLYKEEPRKLIYIGIINDTDQTKQKATSYFANLQLHRS
jgi:hypothetical protein